MTTTSGRWSLRAKAVVGALVLGLGLPMAIVFASAAPAFANAVGTSMTITSDPAVAGHSFVVRATVSASNGQAPVGELTLEGHDNSVSSDSPRLGTDTSIEIPPSTAGTFVATATFTPTDPNQFARSSVSQTITIQPDAASITTTFSSPPQFGKDVRVRGELDLPNSASEPAGGLFDFDVAGTSTGQCAPAQITTTKWACTAILDPPTDPSVYSLTTKYSGSAFYAAAPETTVTPLKSSGSGTKTSSGTSGGGATNQAPPVTDSATPGPAASQSAALASSPSNTSSTSPLLVVLLIALIALIAVAAAFVVVQLRRRANPKP